MAVDAKTLKEISVLLAKFKSTGKDIATRSRDLLTALYAINEGFVGVNESISEVLQDVESGAFDKKQVRAHLKSLGLVDDVISKILKKREELDKYNDAQIKSTDTYRKAIDLIYSTEKNRLDSAFDLFSIYEKFNVQVARQSKLLGMTEDKLGGNTDQLYKQLKAHKQLTGVFQNELVDVNELKSHYDTVNDLIANISSKKVTIEGLGTINTEDAIVKMKEISDQQLKLIDLEDAQRRKKLTAFAAWSIGKIVDTKTGDVFTETGVQLQPGPAKVTLEVIESMTDRYQSMIDMVVQHGKLTDELNAKLTESERLFIKEAAISKQQLELWKSRVQVSSDNLMVLRQFKPTIQNIEAAGNSVVDSFAGLANQFPPAIRGFLGFDQAIQRGREANAEAIKVMNESIVKTGSVSQSAALAFEAWAPSISSALNPVGLLALAIFGLFKFTRKLEETYRNISKDFDISVGQAKELYKVNLDIVNAQQNIYLTVDKIMTIQQAQVKSLGLVFDLMTKNGAKLAIELGNISTAFGYSADQAVALNTAFEEIGANDELATKLQTELGFMSEMAGLSPNIISRDLIDNAGIVATYFAGMPKEAARTVLAIRRMGVSLKDAGNLAQRMLDLEPFMTDMFELAAMGGPDFSKAFEFGITGDLENMTKSVMDSIGSLEAFNKMDFLTRQKIAKTVGMSTDELAKSLLVRQKLVGLGQTEKDFVEANLNMFGDIQDMDQQAIRNRIAEVGATQRLDAAWSKIKAALINAILPAVEGLSMLIDGLGPAIDFVVGIFKGMAAVVNVISIAFEALMWPIKNTGKLLELIQESILGVDKSVKTVNAGVGDMLFSFEGVGKAIGAIIGGLAAYKMFGGIVGKIVAKIPLIGNVISKLPAGGLFGKIFGAIPSAGKLSEMLPKGGFLSKIFGKLPLDEIDSAKKKMGEMTGGSEPGKSGGFFSRLFGKKSEVAPPVTEKDTTTAEKSVRSLSERIQSAISGIGNVIKSTMKTVGGIIRSGLTELKMIVRSLGTFISDLLTQIGKIATTGVKSVRGVLKELLGLASDVVKNVGSIFKGAVGGISGAFSKLYKAASEVVTSTIKAISKSASKLSDAARDIIENIVGAAKKVAPKIVDILKELVSGTFKILTKVVTKLSDLLTTILDKLSDVLKEGIKTVKSVITKGLDAVQSIVSSVLDAVGNILNKIADIGKSVFDRVADVVRSGSKLIKDVVGNLVSMIGDSLKTLGSAIGNVIKSILTSIGDGLSSFGSQALKGAAAMLVLSAALYVTAEALGKFSDVSWDDVMKGMVSIGLLAGVAKMLGKASGSMITGSVAIAALGVSLLPAAYALQQFAGVSWGDVMKGMVAIGTIAGIAKMLGSASTDMLLGAASIAVLGAALIPMAFALDMFAKVEWGSIGKAFVALLSLGALGALASLVAPELIIGAAGIAVFGLALMPFAYALQMFSDVEWGGILKGLGALILFGTVGALLSVVSVPLLFASGAIAALGISLISFAYGAGELSKVKWDNLDGAATAMLKVGGAAAVLGIVSPLLIAGSLGLAMFGASAGMMVDGMAKLAAVDWGVMNVVGTALQKFSASVAIFGLTAPLLIAGSIAMAALGMALVPMASAIKALSSLDFSGVQSGFSILSSSIIQLGTSVALLGVMSPALILGSVALAAFGAVISAFSSTISSTASTIDQLIESLGKLSYIDGDKISGIGSALTQLGAGLAGFGAGSMITGISTFFGGDPFKKLIQLAEVADPLDVASKAINLLGESLLQLSDALETIDLSKLSSLDSLKGIVSQVSVGYQMRREVSAAKTSEPSPMMTAQNVSIAEPEPPSPVATAQNVSIRESKAPIEPTTPAVPSLESMLGEFDSAGGTKRLEALMMQLIKVVQDSNNRSMVLQFDDGTVRHLRNKTRALNNNR